MALKDGDFVLINYVISVKEDDKEIVQDTNLEDVARKSGIYDANRRYGPYLVVIGKSGLLPAIDEALREMDVGQKKELMAPPEKAYGPHRDDLVIRVPIKQLNRYGIQPVVGRKVEVGGRIGVIKGVTERFAYIDFNHPLAGKELRIELEVTKKLETPEEKVSYLVRRYMPIDTNKIKVNISGPQVEVTLPKDVLALNDLESRLQLLASDMSSFLGASSLRIVVEIELKEETQGQQAQPPAQQTS